MRRVTRNGVIAVVAASGAMAATGAAYADSTADGSAAGSPGLISGNSVQLPVHVPVNVCGNTVNVVGLLNPAAGNSCAHRSESGPAGSGGPSAGTSAESETEGSPGVLSGNGVQLPVELPVNLSGNSVNVVGVGNPVLGNESSSTSGHKPEQPRPSQPPRHPEEPEHPAPPAPEPAAPPRSHTVPPAEEAVPPPHSVLARTGTDATLPLAAGSAALLLGGLALHHTFRRRTTD
ncbi:chaplin [Streptomyces sp. NPDC093094]|uniref:chaplin n=1 Tax=Streptomyces sp. NPDC093094 TaxID=3366026 RepID=UPI0038058413